MKNFEKDKSELEAIRFKNFFHQVDKLLDTYLVDDMPLILLGSEKILSWFKEVSRHERNIINSIPGNYAHLNSTLLAEVVWPAMLAYLGDEREQLIDEFEQKIGEHLGMSAIQEIWEAAGEGRALKLLVEKDFRCPGFIIENDPHLWLRPPKKPHRILADAVDELIEIVLEKGGQVYFTDNDRLKDYDRIVLITRY